MHTRANARTRIWPHLGAVRLDGHVGDLHVGPELEEVLHEAQQVPALQLVSLRQVSARLCARCCCVLLPVSHPQVHRFTAATKRARK